MKKFWVFIFSILFVGSGLLSTNKFTLAEASQDQLSSKILYAQYENQEAIYLAVSGPEEERRFNFWTCPTINFDKNSCHSLLVSGLPLDRFESFSGYFSSQVTIFQNTKPKFFENIESKKGKPFTTAVAAVAGPVTLIGVAAGAVGSVIPFIAGTGLIAGNNYRLERRGKKNSGEFTQSVTQTQQLSEADLALTATPYDPPVFKREQAWTTFVDLLTEASRDYEDLLIRRAAIESQF